jgi:uncharacterized protein
MKPYVSLITLGVDSIQRSREFYEGVLGFPVKVASEGFVAYELNNLVFGLYPRDALTKDIEIQDTGKGFSGITLAHNLPTNDEVVALLDAVRASGNKIVKEPKKVDWGEFIGGYFADPDGHLWEVTSNPSGMYEEHVPSDDSVQKRGRAQQENA